MATPALYGMIPDDLIEELCGEGCDEFCHCLVTTFRSAFTTRTMSSDSIASCKFSLDLLTKSSASADKSLP
jgi:hypothetical protein